METFEVERAPLRGTFDADGHLLPVHGAPQPHGGQWGRFAREPSWDAASLCEWEIPDADRAAAAAAAVRGDAKIALSASAGESTRGRPDAAAAAAGAAASASSGDRSFCSPLAAPTPLHWRRLRVLSLTLPLLSRGADRAGARQVPAVPALVGAGGGRQAPPPRQGGRPGEAQRLGAGEHVAAARVSGGDQSDAQP